MEGVYLAIGVVGIYLILGPLVLTALYVLFDIFIEKEPKIFRSTNKNQKDISFWTEKEVKKFLRKKRLLKNERIS